MYKITSLLLLPLFAIILSGCSLLSKPQPAALKVTSIPQATVFIDGKHAGTTPYLNEELEAGEVTLKLVPEQASTQAIPFEGLVELTSGVVTVVNHQFATDENSAAGEMLALQPNNRSVASISIVSQPDAAVVRIDGESKGFTPLVIEQIDAGDHQLLISSPGYQERTINVKTQTGYRLVVSTQLSKSAVPEQPDKMESDEATDSADPNDDEDTVSKDAPNSASPTPKPTSKSTSEETPDTPYVKINDTPTGWLNVRSEAVIGDNIISKVDPGDTFPLLDEQSGWYQIELDDGTEGWIAGAYAEKYE